MILIKLKNSITLPYGVQYPIQEPTAAVTENKLSVKVYNILFLDPG
jgi:hypothetical protein